MGRAGAAGVAAGRTGPFSLFLSHGFGVQGREMPHEIPQEPA